MTQEDKDLLLKDLCARLPYGVKCNVPIHNEVMTLSGKRLNYFCFHKDAWGLDFSHELEVVLDPLNDSKNECIIKPYLRPMSSMTEEELKEFQEFRNITPLDWLPLAHSWLLEHHFDYRGLIKKGLALKAPDGMYIKKNKIYDR